MNATGNAVIYGAKKTGSAIVTGAKATGSAIETGAKVTGNAIVSGAKATGSAIATGAEATGSAVASGAEATGSAISNAASNSWNYITGGSDDTTTKKKTTPKTQSLSSKAVDISSSTPSTTDSATVVKLQTELTANKALEQKEAAKAKKLQSQYYKEFKMNQDLSIKIINVENKLREEKNKIQMTTPDKIAKVITEVANLTAEKDVLKKQLEVTRKEELVAKQQQIAL